MFEVLRQLAEEIGIDVKNFREVGSGKYEVTVMVSPPTALVLLTRNFDRNRSVKSGSVKKYAKDMMEGRWLESPDVIAMDQNGKLINGQHRLHAVVESGCTIPFRLSVGWPLETAVVMDQNSVRSGKDVVSIMGFDTDNIDVGTAKGIFTGFFNYGKQISGVKLLTLMENQNIQAAIAWMKDNFQANVQKISKPVPVRSAIGRAYLYYRHDPEKVNRLSRFCSVLYQGQYENIEEDRVAFQLREKLYDEKNWGQQKELYALTTKAIERFMARASVRNMTKANDEIFPITL